MSHSYSIKILGDAGVGKTSFIQKIITDTFKKQWNPTFGTVIHPIVFETSYGPITLTIVDTDGQSKHDSIQYENYDGTILMFDLTSNLSYRNIPYWHTKCGNEPAWLIGNKTDCKDIKVTEVNEATTISVKKGTWRPVICEILRNLSGHSDLTLIE